MESDGVVIGDFGEDGGGGVDVVLDKVFFYVGVCVYCVFQVDVGGGGEGVEVGEVEGFGGYVDCERLGEEGCYCQVDVVYGDGVVQVVVGQEGGGGGEGDGQCCVVVWGGGVEGGYF